jgi:peroxiredoxin
VRKELFSNSFCLSVALAISISLAGCGQNPPQDQFTSDEASAESASGPLSTNDFDNGVVTTAAEEPENAPKSKAAARRATAADVEAAEGLDEEETSEAVPEPEVGTPEYLLREVAQLKAAPWNRIRQPVSGKPGEFEEIELSPEQAAKEQQRRLLEIVDLSMQVISATKDKPKQAQLFNNAVYYLSDARKQLALLGDPDQAQLLSEDADALFKRDKTSFAAVESALRIVQLAQAQAEQSGRTDTRWASAFAKQARIFAEKFPQETNRAAMNLLAAGRTCEQVGLIEDATACYTTIEDRYPDSPFQESIVGALRRLRLPGQKLTEFAGSTIEGGFVSIDQFAGHPVLIVFWSANSKQFVTDLPKIEQAMSLYGPRGLMVVGVNLDKDQVTVDRFVEQHSIAWNNIFFSDPESRGVRNPVARHYGVTSVPVYWLVDSQGVVRAAPLDLAKLDGFFSKGPAKTVSATRESK